MPSQHLMGGDRSATTLKSVSYRARPCLRKTSKRKKKEGEEGEEEERARDREEKM